MRLLMSDRALNTAFKDADLNKMIDLSSLKIRNCVGCFGCWVKTPGKCVIRDDATKVYPIIAKSEEVVYVSRVKYGSYDSVMKTMLERAIPVQQAFIRLHNGETHHVQRNVVEKKATIIAYGNIDDEEKDVFRQLVTRNAHNMLFSDFKVLFSLEVDLEKIIASEVSTWGN